MHTIKMVAAMLFALIAGSIAFAEQEKDETNTEENTEGMVEIKDETVIEYVNGIYWRYEERFKGSAYIWDARCSASMDINDDSNLLSGIVVVPETLGGMPVEGISHCGWLKNVSGVVIPRSVCDIGDNSLDECQRLEKIIVAADNPEYSSKDGILYDKSGKTLLRYPAGRSGDVVVPDGVESIESGAFDGCSHIRRIAIPSSVREIYISAFDGCLSLEEFSVAADNPKYSSKDGILCDKSGKTFLCCPAGLEGDVVIPDGVETIGDDSFAGCRKVKSLTIPPSVREMRSAFASLFEPSCEGLRAIHISDLAAWCRITFETGSGSVDNFDKQSNPLFQAHNLYLNGKLVTDMEIPAGVESIGDMAFIGCMNLRRIIIPNGVTNIGNSAFKDCKSLEGVEIHEGVKSIGEGAFANCIALREIELPDSVSTIGRPVVSFSPFETGAFEGCSSLQRAVLPKTLREIPKKLFSGCINLDEVKMPKILKVIGDGAFSGCKRLQEIKISKGVKEIGSTERWLFKGVFEGCESLREVEIPDSVEKIGSRTFAGCASLGNLKMGSNVKSIGAGAFDGCKLLKFDEKSMPGFKMKNGMIVERTAPLGETLDLTGAKGILDGAIGGGERSLSDDKVDPELEKVRRIVLPEGMRILNLDTFAGCGNVRELTIPPSVTEIHREESLSITFRWKHLEKVNIRDLAAWSRIDFDVDTICHCCPDHGFPTCRSNPIECSYKSSSESFTGAKLFLDGKPVTNAIIEGAAGRVGKGAYFRYGDLESVVIEDGVKEIGDFAFYDCNNLVSLVIADSVTNIGRRAFMGCNKLKFVRLPKSLAVLGPEAFIECNTSFKFDIAEDADNFTIIDGVLYTKDLSRVVRVPFNKFTVMMPDATSSLAPFAVRSIVEERLIDNNDRKCGFKVQPIRDCHPFCGGTPEDKTLGLPVWFSWRKE